MNYFKKILFIGLGKIALKHINIIRKFYPETEISVLRSGKGKKYNNSILYNNLNSFSEIKKKNFNAIFITSPSSVHYRVLKKIYKEKTNLFIEKPIFNKLEKINNIIRFIDKHKIINQVGYVFRHDEMFIEFKRILKNNILGKIFYINIHCGSSLENWNIQSNPKKSIYVKKSTGGGALLELSHEIDYALWFFGKIKYVYSHLFNTKTFGNQVEDTANIILTNYKNDTINMHLNFWQKSPERTCIVYGATGMIKLDIIKRKIFIKKNNKTFVNKFESKLQNSYENQINNFISCIKSRTKSKISIKDSIESLKIIEKIKLSNNLNKRIRV